MELDSKALALFTEGYEKIIEGLAFWGFDADDLIAHKCVNKFATKQKILDEFRFLVDRVKTNTGAPCTSCFVKIHLMGHTLFGAPGAPKPAADPKAKQPADTKGNPPADKKQEPAPTPPDAERHYGLATWDAADPQTEKKKGDYAPENVLYDYEVEHYVKEISDCLNSKLVENGGTLVKADTGILVQTDQCWGEEMLSKVANISLVYAGWSAGKNARLHTPFDVDPDDFEDKNKVPRWGATVSPYAQGFTNAISTDPEGTTIDDAHKQAADLSDEFCPKKYQPQGAGYAKTPDGIKTPGKSSVVK